jgi:hypothetical protein
MAQEPKNQKNYNLLCPIPDHPTSNMSGLDNDNAKFSDTIEAMANDSLVYLRFFFSHNIHKKPYIIRKASNDLAN